MHSDSPASSPKRIAQVAIPVPLSRVFDYAIGKQMPVVGGRVRVSFAGRHCIGVVVALTDDSTYELSKLKPIDEVLDTHAILPADIMQLGEQASRYYHHPIGEVLHTCLPNALAKGRQPDDGNQSYWQISEAGKALIEDPKNDSLKRAKKQRAVLDFLNHEGNSVHAQRLNEAFNQWRPSMSTLIEKGYVEERTQPSITAFDARACEQQQLTLNEEQTLALAALREADGFTAFLLNGITGSGKTEVYLQHCADQLAAHKQILILVPEIGLTPQLMSRFQARFNCLMVCMHSGMTDLERLNAWRLASTGAAQIVIGTRSALFTPMPELGLIILDEEHDGSFKQQDGFRYHARDLALLRAQNAGINIIMGSATPAFESLHNAQQNRYHSLPLTQRAGNAQPPRIAVIDSRKTFGQSLCTHTQEQIKKTLKSGEQVIIFLNRRGYAPILSCPSCGWHAECQRCDANMTLHHQPYRLHCHHCTAERYPEKVCPNCGFTHLETTGQGTEQLEEELRGRFADARVLRIDRDSTRAKGALESQLNSATQGDADILIGTQMLAKGHHFPNVTLVCILDADRGIFSADFRGVEFMGQLILQVAGRAGREQKRGTVLIQSRQPDHPLLHTLITQGYTAFSQACMAERKALALPPFAHYALLRAESVHKQHAMRFLTELKHTVQSHCPPSQALQILGPVPSPMERRAGRFRAQLLIHANDRRTRHEALHQIRHWAEHSKQAHKVRWSLDVDPMDMF